MVRIHSSCCQSAVADALASGIRSLVLITLPWLLPAQDWFLHSSNMQESFGGNVWIYAYEECQKVEGTFPLTVIPNYATTLADALCTLCTPPTTGVSDRSIEIDLLFSTNVAW
jgi:hypothetical protein